MAISKHMHTHAKGMCVRVRAQARDCARILVCARVRVLLLMPSESWTLLARTWAKVCVCASAHGGRLILGCV